MACLGQCVFHEGAMRFFGFGNAQLRLRHHLNAERREHSLEFAQLAGIVGSDDQLVHCASALRCNSTSWPMPCLASSSSVSISSREKGWPSAVPCTSTKWPLPSITTFMSVSQSESSG